MPDWLHEFMIVVVLSAIAALVAIAIVSIYIAVAL